MDIDVTIEGIKSKNGKDYYVSNPALLKLIIISKELDKLTDEAVQMLMLMVDNIVRKKYYSKSEERDDCCQQALLDCLMYWRGFDPEKSDNPFAYFTSMISNGLAKGWNQLHPEDKNPHTQGCTFTSLDNNIYSI